MPVLTAYDYTPGFFTRSGHINTIYPYLWRRELNPDYQRERVITPDHDFIDIDTIKNNNSRLAILCHGLEGSSFSKYIQYSASILSENNWDVVALNYRGCSGEINVTLQMYHSGFTQDLHLIIEKFKEQYDHISLAGFSLGGNILMKYLGENKYVLSDKIKSAVAISVPCDLSAGAQKLCKWYNYIYQKRFLITLIQKIKLKNQLYPEDIDLSHLKKIKTLWDFDHYYTGPLHGFKDAEDYYRKSSCKQFLPFVKIPSLIISALDDPFLPEESYPYSETSANDYLGLITPRYGGHVGFTLSKSKYYWEEKMIVAFFENPRSFLK